MRIFPNSTKTAQREEDDILGDSVMEVMKPETQYLYVSAVGDLELLNSIEKASGELGISLEYKGSDKSRFYRVHKSQWPKLPRDKEGWPYLPGKMWGSGTGTLVPLKYRLSPAALMDDHFSIYETSPWTPVA